MDTEKTLGITYQPRVLDDVLESSMKAAGAVIIEGPRACGKTMTGLNAATSHVFCDEPEVKKLADISVQALLDGARPRLIDEWQVIPDVWNAVRRAVDRSSTMGNFILTGSAVPDDDVTRHTGAGRFLRLRQRTLTWWERGDSTGAVSLKGLFDGQRPATDTNSTDYAQVVEKLLRSGFPAYRGLTLEQSVPPLRAYLREISRTDVRRIANIAQEPQVIERLIQALARATATEVRYSTIAADMQSVAPGIKAETIAKYIELLQRLFVVETQPPWTPNLRSRARLRLAHKLHLADPSLAVVALRATSESLMRDPATAGFLFESAVVHDLLVFAEVVGGEVRHFRDSNGHEIDAIVELPDGRWGAVEVKLGFGQLRKGAESLSSAIDQIDTELTGEPSFRLVLTGNGPTMTLDDGMVTCPLSALKH